MGKGIDAKPYTDGVRFNDRVSTIAQKGTSLPFKSKQNFTTVIDDQSEMSCQILQGEFSQASKNKLIKAFTIYGIPKMKAGEPSVETEYIISVSGVLYINKHVRNTGKISQMIVDLTATTGLIS